MIIINQFPAELPLYVGIDIECTSKNGRLSRLYLDDIVLVQVSAGEDVYVIDQTSFPPFAQKLKQLLEDDTIVKVFHNSVFDLGFLGISLDNPKVRNVWDTMIAERVIVNGTKGKASLKFVADKYLGVQMDKTLQSSFGSGSISDDQIAYAAKDAEVLVPIMEAQKGLCIEAVINLENSLAPIVAKMEIRGMGFDGERWKALRDRLVVEKGEANNRAQDQLGLEVRAVDLFGHFEGINLNSRNQVLPQLRKIGINLPDYRKATLESYLVKHPRASILQDILDFKAVGSHKYDEHVNPFTGRIHARYNQLGAETGRFACSDPNLQNVPAQKRFRSCFTAAPGMLLVTADYAQQEMRLMAQVTGDPHLRFVCQAGDIHAEIAKLMYHDDTIEKGDKRRDVAKNGGFAWAYGSGAETLANTVKIPLREAREVIKSLDNMFCEVEPWAAEQLRYLYQTGYVETLLGRRRYITDALGSREIQKYARIAKNTPIQGSGGDMIKMAMVDIGELDGVNILSTVHDEIIVEVDAWGAEETAEEIAACMVRAGEQLIDCVPVGVDYVIATEWSKA